jgi:hypothetical protein
MPRSGAGNGSVPCTAASSARPLRWSGRPPRTGSGRWTCPIGGSGRAAEPTARCSRCSAPRWFALTPRCSPPSTTRKADGGGHRIRKSKHIVLAQQTLCSGDHPIQQAAQAFEAHRSGLPGTGRAVSRTISIDGSRFAGLARTRSCGAAASLRLGEAGRSFASTAELTGPAALLPGVGRAQETGQPGLRYRTPWPWRQRIHRQLGRLSDAGRRAGSAGQSLTRFAARRAAAGLAAAGPNPAAVVQAD